MLLLTVWLAGFGSYGPHEPPPVFRTQCAHAARRRCPEATPTTAAERGWPHGHPCGVEHNPRHLQYQHDCRPMALGGLDVDVDHDDDVDCPYGGVGDPSYHLELESLVDGDLDGVECLSLLEGEGLLDDVGLVVGEGPSSLVDEVSLGDDALGDGDVLDHSHSVRGFLRWSGESFANLTVTSDYDLDRGACSWNLGFERSAHCFHVERLDGAPHSGVSDKGSRG